MLDETIRKLAAGRNIGAVTTLLPDGTPMTQPLWVDADDDHLLLNTEVHRQKFRNVQSDPRVTVALWDSADPYFYVEVRGDVVDVVRGPEARAHIDELARKYTGGDYAATVTSERVILKVAPTRRQFIRGR
jgi:PPOX class probable F420-dependent enzyme